MKQLLIRVDDELHAQLTAQARVRGTSVNALANDILGLGVDPGHLSRTDQLRLKLMQLGEIRGSGSSVSSPAAPPALLVELEALRAQPAEIDEIDAFVAAQRGAGRWP
jgi:antitoxin FitA